MKKFLLMITAVLSISLMGLAGCMGDDKSKSDNSFRSNPTETVQSDDPDGCEDENCGENEQTETPDCEDGSSCPRKPETSENGSRTSDSNDGNRGELPDPDFHKPHRRHRKVPAPIPSPNPLQPR